ncbi:hypothetical protein [Geodermatophilus amargosae]|uniref:hypothetical protein n=1 Tax=Geodermatophilus amargosae TaxID=1296565 RepID=UPI001587DAA0|nr:hypothetical protein [Geodermatophilus amargosae]
MRRRAQSPGARLRIGRQLGGTGPGGDGRLVTAAGGGALSDVIERGDDLFVGPVGGGGQAPRATVRVAGQRIGERAVRGTALRPGGRPVDRGAHQRPGSTSCRHSSTGQQAV